MDREAAQLLQNIADKIDVPVEQLWAGLVAYAPFVGLEWAISGIIGIFVIIVSSFVARWAFKGNLVERGNPSGRGIVFGISIATLVISSFHFFGATVGGAANGLSALNAPEGWASKTIINRVLR